jgi:hypothetical protein
MGFSFFAASIAPAQEPAINATVPAAAPPGATVNVQLQGGGLANAKGLWANFPVTAVLAPGIEGNGANAAAVTFQLTIPPDVAPGVYGIRVVTDHGVSPIRLFLIDDLPTIAQAGNNTAITSPQVIALPAGIDGNVAGLTKQYFKFAVQAGQVVSFEVLARRIGSPLDPVIRLLDLRGKELASNDDALGLGGDSQLSYTFPAAGEYLLELRDIRFQGGPYRLRIGDFPCAAVAYPLAVQRGTATPVVVAGKFIDGVTPTTVTAPADAGVAWMNVAVKRTGGLSSGLATVAVVDNRQFLEQEPNDAPNEANRIELGMDANGKFDKPGDVDRFIFAAKKDQSYVFTGVTRQLGSPADLSFKLLGPDGAQIAAAEDAGTAEGFFAAKFPADGDFTLVVEELNKRGGPEFAYRIAVTTTSPPFTIAAATDTLNIPAGGAVPVLVTSTRPAYAGPIEISVAGLPDGLTASKTVIGPGRNAAVLTVHAPPDFAGGQLHSVKIVGAAKIGDADVTATADISGVLKGRFANMRFPPPALTTSLAASAAPANGLVLKVEPAEIVFGKDLSAKVKLIAERSQGLDEAIAVAVFPPQDGLPAGITAAVKNIDKGANEVEVVFSANAQAPLGEFTGALQGTLKQGDKTVVQPFPAIRLKLQAPMTISADVGGGKIARGGELVVKVKVQRNPAFSGPVTLTIQNLPAGVTAAPAMLPPDAAEIEVKLKAAADAAQGAKADVNVKGEGMNGNAKLESVSPNVTITVE